MKEFDTFGVMLDCSRNAVMTVPELKRFMTVLSRMGYNQFQLYMEDTYEVDSEPYFGHFRGRYTQAELRELDDFADSIGMELVPCVQTLAHFNALVRWPEYEAITDDADILLVGEERTYALIEHMFASLRRCFRTDKIHIGMDEAHRLGKGRYRDLHGERNRFEILTEHLSRVCKLAEQYGFHPMMWSDMFYRLANGGAYYPAGKAAPFDESVRAQIPESVSLVYWDYYHTDKASYRTMLRGHRQLSDKVIFAGGAWKWSGFTPHNAFSVRALKAALPACREEGVRDVLITMWGDNGGEASAWSVLPSLCYAACVAQGITAMDGVREKFAEWVGCRYDDFLLLDLPDTIVKSNEIVTPSKYQLYNDCFMGLMDSAHGDEDARQYARFARRLRNAAKRVGDYAYLFETLAALCALLALKADIGERTRVLYAGGNREAMEPLVAEYGKMLKRLDKFHRAFRTQWYRENKPQGFEVQDIRLGGLRMRMADCQERISDYIAGRVDTLPELEEPMLPFPHGNGVVQYNSWMATVTANCL